MVLAAVCAAQPGARTPGHSRQCWESSWLQNFRPRGVSISRNNFMAPLPGSPQSHSGRHKYLIMSLQFVYSSFSSNLPGRGTLYCEQHYLITQLAFYPCQITRGTEQEFTGELERQSERGTIIHPETHGRACPLSNTSNTAARVVPLN